MNTLNPRILKQDTQRGETKVQKIKKHGKTLEGFRSGLSPSTVADGFNEKGCPLTDNTIRNQLKDAFSG